MFTRRLKLKKNSRKLETTKGGLDTLPHRGLSKIVLFTPTHLYCASRQGASYSTFVASTKPSYCSSADVRSHVCNLPVRISFFFFSELLTHTLTVIHSVLTLAIQNGAFLHLVVTLAAIIARLAHLSTSLRRAPSSLHAECLHLFDKLYVRGEQPVVR